MSLLRSAVAEPLIEGQELDRETFHERYEASPPGLRAELIGGVVVMPSPVGDRHAIVSGNAVTWLNLYKYRTPGVQVGDNGSAALDDSSEVQPDASMRILPERGGQTTVIGGIIGGAPELVVEVSQSSRSIDLGAKRLDYERTGTREYIVLALDPDELFWHRLEGGRLVRVPPDFDGIYRSTIFPGLWLDPAGLLDDDGPAMVATLELGLATQQPAVFVAKLAGAIC